MDQVQLVTQLNLVDSCLTFKVKNKHVLRSIKGAKHFSILWLVNLHIAAVQFIFMYLIEICVTRQKCLAMGSETTTKFVFFARATIDTQFTFKVPIFIKR